MNAAELFRAVYERPDDDGARQVLADVLIEAGDPRGEFIALQMASQRTRKATLKIDRLLERHRLAFLGPLASVVSRRGQVWEKGFLTACEATLDGSLVDEPSWATVQRLELFNSPDAREVLGPHLSSLKELTGLPRAAVVPVFSGPRSSTFSLVGVDGPGAAESWEPRELDALRVGRSLPALRTLSLAIWRFGVDELEWLWTAPIFGRVRVLELRLQRLALHLGTLRDRLLLLDEAPDSLVLKGRQLELKWKPTEAWSVVHLHVRAPLVELVIHDVELLLQSLPPNALTRFELTLDHPSTLEALARVKAVVKRFTRLAPVTWPRVTR